jgi:hypothetical protein
MSAVSVIMIAHLDSPYLRPAIASIFAQSFKDFEFVFVDNGVGFPADIFGEFADDRRLRWVKLQSHQGIARGINAGIAVSSSDLIALMDSDDVSLPLRLERQLRFLREEPDIGLISAFAERIDGEARPLGSLEFCLVQRDKHFAYTQYAATLVTPAIMGRREIFLQFPFRSEFAYASDLDFQARVAEKYAMAVIPEVLLKYRWYQSQTTQSKADLIARSLSAIQLLAARRRAGLEENMATALELTNASSVSMTWRLMAKRSAAEGYYVLSAYQARRSLAVQRSVGAAMKATALFLKILAGTPKRTIPDVVRMFFTGPVRLLGLQLPNAQFYL